MERAFSGDPISAFPQGFSVDGDDLSVSLIFEVLSSTRRIQA
jgi:hypothetical protein